MKINLRRFGFLLMVGGFLATTEQTIYFGNHFFPHSDMELMADLVSSLPSILGLAVFFSCDRK